MYIPQYFLKAMELCRSYKMSLYSPKEYAMEILKMKRRDIRKIEVCDDLPNIANSYQLDDINYIQCNKMCIVTDKYTALLFPL